MARAVPGDVGVDRAAAVEPGFAADDGRGQADLDQGVQPRVVLAQVGQDHAVDVPAGPPLAVHVDGVVDPVDEVQHQGDVVAVELGLDPAEHLREPGVDDHHPRRADQDQPDRVRLGGAQRPGGDVRRPAEVPGGGEDPRAGLLGHAGPVVERIGHRGLGHPGVDGDLADRDPRLAGRLCAGVLRCCGHLCSRLVRAPGRVGRGCPPQFIAREGTCPVRSGVPRCHARTDSSRRVLVSPDLDSIRYDDLWNLDLRVARSFMIGRRSTQFIADLFNVMNANTVLVRNRNIDSPSFGRIAQNLSPRILRFGVRVGF